MNSTIDTQKPAATETDAAQSQADDSTGERAADSTGARTDDPYADIKSPRLRRSINIGIRSLVVGAVIAISLGAATTLAWLYIGAQHQLHAQADEAAETAHAERLALDYAVNAASMNFKDLQAWKVALVAGTSPELNDKLTDAAASMEQIMVPLQWTSTAEPLVAKVRSHADGTFVVDCFVSVQTKTVQAAEPLQSTATYSITIDSNNAWQITDVGGVGKVVGPK